MDSSNGRNIYLRIIVNMILCVGGFILLIFLLPKLLKFFLPFFIAYIISSIANPLVSFLEKKVKILRKHSTAVIIVLVISVLILIMYAIIYMIVREAQKLYADLPNFMNAYTTFINELTVSLADVAAKMPENVKLFFNNLSGNIETSLSGFINSIIELPTLSDAGSYFSSVANVLVMTIITVLASYFILADRTKLEESFKKVMPESTLQGFHLIKKSIKDAVGGYFKAQFKIMIILMAIMFITFEIMDVRYSFLVALGIALLDFLPVFGTGTILWPWAVICMITENYLHTIILIILYFVCLIIKQLMQPKMVGDSVGISPLAALFFMFVGYQIKGVIGMIIGIPFGMILITFYKAGAFDRLIRGFRIIFEDLNRFRKF